jgi:molybdopterin synthase catalytic subunit
MMAIAKVIKAKHSLNAIAVVHRLGEVPVLEESVLIAVSSPHREAAWRAGEEALEEIKSKVEIWKYEKFEDGGAWRANRDGVSGIEEPTSSVLHNMDSVSPKGESPGPG